MPRRVSIAVLLSLLCHGLFILTARYRLSYDAYTHMLFADHYARDWFSLWEPRWYTGFTVVSYPPLVHQLIAFAVPILGFDTAYALVSWAVTTIYPLGIYAFARIFAGRTAASYAALSAALLVPIYVAAYIFGQLPFLTGTLFALFAAASLDQYLRYGGAHNFALTVGLIATSMASHHATLLVQPFLVLAVAMNNLWMYAGAHPARVFYWTILKGLVLFGASAIAMELLVIWPFWQWGTGQDIQTSIDHLSRHNFFLDPLAFAVFFFPMYGPLVLMIPFLMRRWPPRLIGLLLSFSTLFLLGLGGTTPLPRLFFGDAWEWLTYDRFAFWASLTLTPLFGILFVRLRYAWKNRVRTKPGPVLLRRSFVSAGIFSVFAATALGTWFWPFFAPTQPESVEMNPIVRFLDQGDRSQWRYLTFGFGNQYTHLNLLTEATTLDGSYHTARTPPELRASGIAEVDTSYWALNGLSAIVPILEKSGEHGVRWGFVNREDFIPVLKKCGWVYQKTLSNGIEVWENPNANLPEPSEAPDADPIASFSWGTFPALVLISTLAIGARKVYTAQTERILQRVHAFLIGLIPISLCYWYFRRITELPHARVYFTYTDSLFFFTDALVLVAVILWASTRFPAGKSSFRLSTVEWLLTALFTLSTLSAFWSGDWRISLYVSIHFWLVFLLVLSLREWTTAWKIAMFGLCMALSIEIVTGLTGFAHQSTAFLDSLQLEWPGLLDPSIRGASVVQLSDGLRILRAYGTLPHPNILGGFALFSLVGPGSLYLAGKKPNYPALVLFCLGIVLLLLTFSRSAWLGLIAFLAFLLWKRNHFDQRRLFLLVAACFMTAALTLYPLRDLVWTRVSNPPVATERLSTSGREWLAEQALDAFLSQPLTGIGMGSLVLRLSTYAPEDEMIEPVHSIPMLAGAELGIPGSLLILGLFLSIASKIVRVQTPKSILAGGMIVGLGVIGLFDHYLWTLAPGRVLLGLALGLWIGQTSHES